MADLLDIVPAAAVEVVRVNGTRIIVRGLRINSVAPIVGRFPNVAGLLLGGLSVSDGGLYRFLSQLGDATGPIIAAGCGRLGDEKFEHFANTALLLEDQLRLLIAIVRLTCPNGFGFFLEMLAKLVGAGEEAKTVKVRSKKSPSPSPTSSDAAFRPPLQ